ncbi:MAG TPA: hypothetical protein VEI07_15415 [Planctomycetaceae bacterium]|nr:hypothetical protein [Planctomycetaceae bacterium]
MELREALEQIAEIRDQLARTETFEGYRSATVAASGLLALGAAGIQTALIPDPMGQLDLYLALWVGVAIVSAAMVGIEMFVRCRRAASETTVRLTRMVVEQFLPCVVVGALLTVAIAVVAPETAWMLPGLWSLVFGLGVFASARLFPRPVVWVAGYYLLAGIACLAAAKRLDPLSPWLMACTFGFGQLLAAAIVYWSVERKHAS